tara:strand:+ start:999 stop:1676 length:678 start_codon:yes stop_codon:yes gene_type:complete
MKKINYLVIFISILVLIIFGLSNYFLKKKDNITYQILINEPCVLSKTLEKIIETYGKKEELFHMHWRNREEHCKLLFRQSNYLFVFKDQKKKDQFIKEINSSKFKKNLKENFFKIKNYYINALETINFVTSELNSNEDLSPTIITKFKNSLIIDKENLEKELIEINGVSDLLETNIPIIEIQKISKIKSIKNFNLKFSIYITFNILFFILIIIYIFRKRQLGFYR